MRARVVAEMPAYLLGRDIDAMRSETEMERVVVRVLRKLGFLQPAPMPLGPRLRLCKSVGGDATQ